MKLYSYWDNPMVISGILLAIAGLLFLVVAFWSKRQP